MDILDFKILRELMRSEPFGHVLIDPRIPLRHIARRLAVDKDTVSSRIKKFRETGFLQGWVAFPNPSIFGVKESRLQFNLPARSSKDDLVRKLRLIPGVTIIASMYGDSILVGLLYESEQSLKKSTELISRISNAEDIFRFDNFFPECKIRLSKTDWEIIRSLQKNPRKSNHLISRELGVTSRTVKRRLERLINGKALTAVMMVDLNAVEGTLVDLLVFYTGPQHRREVNERILSHLDDCIFRAELGDERHGLFNLFITNIARVQEISRWMGEQPGVSSFRVDLIQEFVQQYEALNELLEKNPVKIQMPA